MLNEVGGIMRRIKLFSLIQERVARRMCPSRWSARRRASWSASGASAAVESLESRCLLSAGDLDLSFGVAGRVTTSIGTQETGGSTHQVAIQSDGKIVVAGPALNTGVINTEGDFGLVRFNADGSLDTSFAGTGKVTTDFGGDESAADLAIQGDGKIVVVGKRNSPSIAVLSRYNPDGSLDASFGGTGKVTTTVGTVASANSVAIQNDGKIVVAGLTTTGADFDFAVVRFNADGSLDTSFGGTGKVTTSTSPGFESANSVVIQDDGKIVVAGYSALVRYNANGSLDATFGTSGKVTTDFAVFNAVLQDDGKIIGVGAHDSSSQFTLERFNADGSLDTSFGGTGKVTHPGVLAQVGSVTVQTDGKIVVVAQQGADDFRIARYDTDGSLDFTFGVNGIVTTDFGLTSDIGRSITLQNDGNIVVAGVSNNRFAVARYFASEQPPAFNSASSVNVAENQRNVLTVTATDPEGRLLTYGLTGGADQATFAINSFTGALTFVAAPDLENPTDSNHDNVYEVQVAVSDGINLAQQTIAVTVTDTNEAPTITSASSVNVAENTTTILTVAGTDPEHGALTYSLAGGADDSLFSLNLTTGALAFLTAPNFESPQDADHNNVYDVRVSVSDGTNTVTQDIHVTVTNVDETPSITSANAASVLENTTSVQTVTASDPEGHFLLYGISGGVDQSKFSINPFSGALSFTSAPDFENPTDANHDNSYEVTVAASDGTNLVTQTISVSVTNANEAPSITSANSVSVPENTTAVMSVAAADLEHDSLSYSLTGGADQTLFNIDPDSGAVSFKSAPNLENPTDANDDNVYSVQVQVSDGTNLVTQNLHITVTNVDESPTITSASTASIAENSTFVVTVTGSDPEGHLPHYGITGGDDQAKFTLNFLTGALSIVSPSDFEHPTDANHDNVYEVQVAVSDGTHLITQDISVTVTDVNETVTIPLPANGGNFKTLFLNGQLHLRTSLGKQLIAPVTLPSGADVQFNGSNATDRLTLDRSWSRFIGRLTFNGNDGNDQLDARTVSLGVTFNGGDGNDTFLGGRGDDTTNGGAGLDSLSGNDGNDSLTGGDGNDKLFGGADGDTLAGDAGTDSLSGGDDDDSLSGGDANDTLTGDTGNDTVTGDTGADSITGGDDDDLLFGNAGNDIIDGGRGEDVIDGGDDNDNLKGSDGDDSIRGNNGNDTLSGGNGNDLLTGSVGNDSLLGDAGIDTLLGDDGNDKLNGGLGTDTINGVPTGLSKDTISDTTKIIDTSFSYDFDALLAGLL